MLAKLAEQLPVGPYLFAPKWDGFSAIVFRGEGDESIYRAAMRGRETADTICWKCRRLTSSSGYSTLPKLVRCRRSVCYARLAHGIQSRGRFISHVAIELLPITASEPVLIFDG